MRGSKFLVVLMLAFCFMAVANVASANTLTLNEVTILHQYQQTSNNPCVIGDPSCNQPAGFDETILPANPACNCYDATSPEYTVAQINAITGGSFIMGFDVNQTVDVQQLVEFDMYVNGVLIDQYLADPYIEVPPTTGGGNGNGYADYYFANFTSLSGFADDDIVTFRAVMSLVNDGREEFFLISTENPPPPVPEPSSLALLGTGLVSAAGVIRRKFFV